MQFMKNVLGHTRLLFLIKPKTLLFLLGWLSCGLCGWGGGIGNKTNPGCFSLSTPSLCNFINRVNMNRNETANRNGIERIFLISLY